MLLFDQKINLVLSFSLFTSFYQYLNESSKSQVTQFFGNLKKVLNQRVTYVRPVILKKLKK